MSVSSDTKRVCNPIAMKLKNNHALVPNPGRTVRGICEIRRRHRYGRTISLGFERRNGPLHILRLQLNDQIDVERRPAWPWAATARPPTIRYRTLASLSAVVMASRLESFIRSPEGRPYCDRAAKNVST
jgi:hypothetical protein